MIGHGEKRTRHQEQAIAALLQHSTIDLAAESVGLSAVTLRRWLRNSPAFQAAYRRARMAAVEHAIGQLQAAAGKAAETLTRNLDCENPAAEIRAAVAILEQGYRGADVLDLATRVAALEAREAKKGGRR
jgi:hypothetical protein